MISGSMNFKAIKPSALKLPKQMTACTVAFNTEICLSDLTVKTYTHATWSELIFIKKEKLETIVF